MSQAKKAAKSVLIIILFTVASKLLGFVREMMMAARYGSNASTDAYFMALSALSLFSVMITKSLFQTTIPVLSTVESIEGKEGKNRHTNNLLNIVIAFSFVAAILAWFFTPYILKILAPGFGEEQFNLTVTLTRIGLFILVISGVVGVFRGYLQSELRFTESAATMIPFNLVFITFLIFFSQYFDIRALMIANVLANLGMLALQIPSIRKAGFRYAPVFELKDEYVKHIAILMPPILLSSVISDVNTLIDKSMASKLVEGSISALNYADRIKGLVTSIFISAIATVIFPILAKNANDKNLDNLKKTMIRGFNVIILITIPASLGLMVLAHPIVRFVFERKAFDARATTMTAGALLYYSIGLLSLSMNTMFRRVYYSLKDTKTPMFLSIFGVVANVLFNLIFIYFMAHEGLALATSLSSILTMGLSFYFLRKKIGPMGMSQVAKSGVKAIIASGLMAASTYGLYRLFQALLGVGSTTQELVTLFIPILVGVLVYGLVIYFMRVDEVDWIIQLFKEKFGRA